MINVFLDTTVFREDPLRRKAAFKTIERLAHLGKVIIRVSDVSRREFITQQELHFDEQVDKVQTALNHLKRKILNEQFLEALQCEVASMKTKRDIIATEFDGWLSRSTAQVHSVADDHGASVLDKYFMGLPPFTKIKSRNDFPDAFIWEAIVDVAKTTGTLIIISNDGALSANLAGIEGVTMHKSLHEFVTSSSVLLLIQRTENMDKVMSFLAAEAKNNAERIALPIVESLMHSNHTPFPEDSEATILDVGPLRELQLSTAEVEDYGDGLFVLPFSAKTECRIQYYMLKAEYWGLDRESTPSSATDWNDHVFEVEDDFDLAISGTLGFQVESEALDGTLQPSNDKPPTFTVTDVAVEDILCVEFVDDATTE